MKHLTSDQHYDEAYAHVIDSEESLDRAMGEQDSSVHAAFQHRQAEIHAQLAQAHVGLSRLARERENEERKLKFVGKE